MAIKLERFDEFHLHGASAPGWQQRHLQKSRRARLLDARPRSAETRGLLGCSVVQGPTAAFLRLRHSLLGTSAAVALLGELTSPTFRKTASP